MSYEDIGLTSQYCLYVKRSRPARGKPWIVVIGCFTPEEVEDAKIASPKRIDVGFGVYASLELVSVLRKKSNGKALTAADDVEGRLTAALERNKNLEKELERVNARLKELEADTSLAGENERVHPLTVPHVHQKDKGRTTERTMINQRKQKCYTSFSMVELVKLR